MPEPQQGSAGEQGDASFDKPGQGAQPLEQPVATPQESDSPPPQYSVPPSPQYSVPQPLPEHVPQPAVEVPGVSTTRRSTEERKALLTQQVQWAIARGGRIQSQSDFQAVVVYGKPVNHVLHAILTIFTCLLWGLVWAILAGTGGEKREMYTIDDYGNVQVHGVFS